MSCSIHKITNNLDKEKHLYCISLTNYTQTTLDIAEHTTNQILYKTKLLPSETRKLSWNPTSANKLQVGLMNQQSWCEAIHLSKIDFSNSSKQTLVRSLVIAKQRVNIIVNIEVSKNSFFGYKFN